MIKILKIRYFLYFQIFLISSTVFSQLVPTTEIAALKAFYTNTNGDLWTNKTGWNVTDPNWLVTYIPTSVYGITFVNNRVKTISFTSDNNLNGTLPNEIGNFSTISQITILGNKNLTGNLPTTIGNLTTLTSLSLYSNKLSGQIPSTIGNLKNLTSIHFYNNQFSGQIPNDIGNLSNLVFLRLDSNPNLSGNLPASFGALNKLGTLWLSGNTISGIIPETWGGMVSMVDLRINGTKLSGNIPDSFSNLKKLKILIIDGELDTPFPSSFGNLPELEQFTLANNKIPGPIPEGLGTCPKLKVIDLDVNQLTGNIPSSFSQLTLLSTLHLATNNLSGTIPPTLQSLSSSLTKVTIAYNSFEGDIPFKNAPGFTGLYLRIDNNKFRFVDIIDNFANNKARMTFSFYPQKKTDSPKIENKAVGQSIELKMFENNRFDSGDTYQWYKNGVAISGATSRKYTINSLALGDAGTYTCKSYHTSSPDMSPLVLEREPITLNVVNCTPVSGQLYIYDNNLNEGELYTCGNRSVTLNVGFNNLPAFPYTYSWTIKDSSNSVLDTSNGTITNSSTVPMFGHIFNQIGNYTGHLTITDQYGCVTNFEPISIPVVKCCDPLNGDIINYNIGVGVSCPPVNYQSIWSNSDSVNNPAVNSWIDYKDLYGNVKRFYTGGIENGCQMVGCVLATNGVQICSDEMKLQASTKKGELAISTSNTTKFDNLNKSTAEVNNCLNQPSYFTFSSSALNTSYLWSVSDPSGNIIITQTETTGYFNFTPTMLGSYTVNLEVTTSSGCKTNVSKVILVQQCAPASCTATNPNTAIVKQLFINLVNHLKNQNNLPNGYTCPELVALSPYITDVNPKIYNFSNVTTNSNYNYLFFSFSNHNTPTQSIPFSQDVAIEYGGSTNGAINSNLTDIDITSYTSSEDYLDRVAGFFENDGAKMYIKHINFCPTDLYCKKHIAIVVDESGSISTKIESPEHEQIKKQLKSFIERQAQDNEELGSNVIVSLIGLSDSDSDTRTDHILGNTKITNANKISYLNWINEYRNYTLRNSNHPNNIGVSAHSDYWASGLRTSLNLSIKPDIVILITDGCETNNVESLKGIVQSFNNNGNNSSGPHLYVIGTEDGFYVDQETIITSPTGKNSNIDPNLDDTISKQAFSKTTTQASAASNGASLTNFLKKSLKYLLGYESTDFPVAFQDNFLINNSGQSVDYFGYPDFSYLAENYNYISNSLSSAAGYSNITCGPFVPVDQCDNCISFKPEKDKEYILSAWAKEEVNTQLITYPSPRVLINFLNSNYNVLGTKTFEPSGDIIEGWQRIFNAFIIPEEIRTQTDYISIELVNTSENNPVYFDDVRIHPVDGSMKSFVYDPITLKLMAELDENNYSTFYEYDKEGGLVRIKKETSRGVKTIQETRSGNVIKN